MVHINLGVLNTLSAYLLVTLFNLLFTCLARLTRLMLTSLLTSSTMSSLSYSLPAKEEEVCWTEKDVLVKEEKEEEAVTVKQEVEGEAVTVKEEEKDVKEEEAFRVKEEDAVCGMKEEGEITVPLEETGDLINTSKCYSKNSGTNSVVVELMCHVQDCGQVSRNSQNFRVNCFKRSDNTLWYRVFSGRGN